MRRYLFLALLLLPALLPSGAGPLEAAGTQVWIFPSVKYVAQSSPGFSVNIRAESVSTPEMHVVYAETNVDTELALGAEPAVRASYAETNVDTALTVGNDAASKRRGQGFRVTAAGPVNRVLLWAKKVGDPLDGLRVEVQGDSGGLPNGVVLGASTVAAGEDMGTAYGWVAFSLPTPPILSLGTQYHLVVNRTSPLDPDPANYFVWGADISSPGYTDGAASVYNGSTWAAAAPAADQAFKVDTAATARAQGFRVPTNSPVNRVLVWLKRVGSLTGNDGSLSVEIRDDSGGVPGVVLGTSTSVQVSLVGTSYGWVLFNVLVPPELSAGTQYHLVLTWTDVPDAPNYIVWGADTSSPGYGNGVAAEGYGGPIWTAATPGADHAFEVAYACPLGPSATGPCGLGAFEIRILFNAADFQYNSMAVGPMLTSTGRALYPCSSPAPHNPSGGVVTYKCNTFGATPLGPQGSGVLATASFTALHSAGFVGSLNLSNTVLNDINNASLAHTSQGNTVRVENLGTNDTDGDGCTDIEEEGDDIAKGGQRNPHDSYDFYDVPVPTRPDPTPNGPRNKKVDMGDVLAVLFYAFAKDDKPPNANGVDYDADKGVDTNGDTVWDIAPDGVDDGLSYDRSAAPPFSGPPNGVVDMGDVLAALIQFGHDCTSAP